MRTEWRSVCEECGRTWSGARRPKLGQWHQRSMYSFAEVRRLRCYGTVNTQRREVTAWTPVP